MEHQGSLQELSVYRARILTDKGRLSIRARLWAVGRVGYVNTISEPTESGLQYRFLLCPIARRLERIRQYGWSWPSL